MEQHQLDQYKEQLSEILPVYRRLGMNGLSHIPDEQSEIYTDLINMHSHFRDNIVVNTFTAVENAFNLGYMTKDVIINHILNEQLDQSISEKPGASRFRGDPVKELEEVVQLLLDGEEDISDEVVDIFVDSVEQVFELES